MSARARLLGYLPWMMRDWALTRAVVPGAIGVGFGGLMAYIMARSGAATVGASGAAALDRIVVQVFGLVLLASAFFTASQFHGEDRARHHHRFLFSKPVEPMWFYLLGFTVHTALFAALATALALVLRPWLPVHSLPGIAAATALGCVFIGGLAFLIGSLVARESPLLLLLYVVSATTHAIVEQAGPALPRWVAAVEPWLPPTHLLSRVQDALLTGGAVSGGHVRVVLAWSLGSLLLGAWLLRRLPLGR